MKLMPLGNCPRLHAEKMDLFVDIKVELAEKDLHDGNANDLFEVFKHLHELNEETQSCDWRRLAGIVVKLDELINMENPAKQWKLFGQKQVKKCAKTRVCLPLG